MDVCNKMYTLIKKTFNCGFLKSPMCMNNNFLSLYGGCGIMGIHKKNSGYIFCQLERMFSKFACPSKQMFKAAAKLSDLHRQLCFSSFQNEEKFNRISNSFASTAWNFANPRNLLLFNKRPKHHLVTVFCLHQQLAKKKEHSSCQRISIITNIHNNNNYK